MTTEMSLNLINGDCLEWMAILEPNSIDLIFCDLPYGQTSCKWDCKIDLEQFWKQIMRIKKTNTPIFFTTTTKFGVELITTAPKKCPFRYDIVWLKSAPVGFLSAKKMPMRKHEMLYVFYEKLPFYDLSSHTHKFIKDAKNDKKVEPTLYGRMTKPRTRDKTYDPPLPVSVVKEIKSTKGKHSTEKPVALMEWILKYYSKEGDVVLDATMGSGSMGVACKNMKRAFIGIEKDKEIFKVAEDRLK